MFGNSGLIYLVITCHIITSSIINCTGSSDSVKIIIKVCPVVTSCIAVKVPLNKQTITTTMPALNHIKKRSICSPCSWSGLVWSSLVDVDKGPWDVITPAICDNLCCHYLWNMAQTRVFCQHAVFLIRFCLLLYRVDREKRLWLFIIDRHQRQKRLMSNRPNAVSSLHMEPSVCQAAASRLESGFATKLTAIDSIVQKINR